MAVPDIRATQNEAAFISSLLKRFGLPSDIGSAIAALAGTIRDHRHLEQLLTKTEPEERQDLYDSIVPHLRFKAWELDKYVASAGSRAEREQWPVMGTDGRLYEFRPATDVKTIEKVAEKAIADELAARMLTVTCYKCLKSQTFTGTDKETPAMIIKKARLKGWFYDLGQEFPQEICPDCMVLRNNA